MYEYLERALLLLPATLTFVETFERSPLAALVRDLNAQARKSMFVIRARRISDHWKERVLQAYGLSIMKGSLLIGVWLAVLAAIFLGVYQATGMIWDRDFNAVVELARVENILSATIIALLYVSSKRWTRHG